MENGTSIVKDDTKKSSEIQTVHTLDKAVQEVQDLKAQGAVTAWHLGKKIKEIADQQLWKLRTTRDATGKEVSQHKSVDQFFEAELGFGRQTAYRLMEVANQFTERQVKEHGTTKLSYLLTLPESARAEQVEKLAKGGTLPSMRETKKMVKEMKAAAGGHVKAPRGGKKDKLVKARAAKAAKAPKSRMTTVALEGKQKVKLYKTDASFSKFPSLDWSALPRSKRVADAPGGVIELANHAKLAFQLTQNAAGELEIIVQAFRDE